MSAEGSIDKLSIEVSSTAASAVQDIKDLSNALAGLEGSIGGSAAKLTEVSRGLTAVKNAAAGLQVGNLKQLGEIRLGKALANNMKTFAAAVSLLPTDSQSRIAPLATLKALDGIKMSTSVGANLAKIATALAFMPTDTAGRLAGLPTLKHLNGVKISSSIPNNLMKIAQAINAFPADAGTRLTGLAKSLLPLKQLKGMSITGALNSLRELPGVLKQYETLNVKNLVAQLDLLNPRLKSLAVAANGLKLAFNKMPASLRTVASATNTVVSANKRLETSVRESTHSIGSFLGKLGSFTAAVHVFRNAFAETIGEVNTYIENMNLFEASMGEYTQAATEFGNKVQELMGIDFGEWARNQGVFQTLITGMGDTAERASVMSQQLTQLGYDISSFYNISVEDAMLKLQSGMAGELEPLRRLGWDLSNARMQLEAYNLGIDEKVTNMTQAEKVGLRYYLIMKQVTQVHGDMARTIASPANQLRVLQAQVTLASRAIGSLLIPMLNTILPYAIAAAKAIRMLAQTIADFLGIDATFEVDYSTLDTSGIASGVDDTADALEDAGKAADKATKKVKEYKNTVMGFDELNKLNDTPEDTSSSKSGKDSGSGSGGAGLDLPLDTYDFLNGLDDYITKLSDDLANKMVGALKKIVPVAAGIGTALAGWKISKALLGNAEKLAGRLRKGSDNAGKLGSKLKDMRFGSTLAKGMRGVELGLMGMAGWLSTIAAFPKQFLAAVAPVIAFAALVAARTTDLWMNSEKFREGVTVIVDWLGKIPELIVDIPAVFKVAAKLAEEVGKKIGDWASSLGIDLSFVGDIAKAFSGVVDMIAKTVSPIVEALDLDLGDLALTVGGIALLFVNPVWGAAVLLFEGITLAIRGIGWASEDCVKSVDALAGVSEETAERFGTSLESMEDATRDLDQLDFANSVISDEDVANIEGKVKDITDTIVNNLDGERNKELAELHSLAGVFTEEEIAATEARINGYYDEQIGIATNGSAEISKIMETAASENRALTEDESKRINEIKDAMYQQLIESSGASQEELAKIDEAMRTNTETAAVEAASAAIKAAKQRKEDTKTQADEEYENTVKWAKQMYDSNEISKERYDDIVKMAEEAHGKAYDAAEKGYDKTIAETKKKLGTLADNIDFETGEIKSNLDKFLGGVKGSWDKFSADFAKSWKGVWDGVGKAFDGFKRNVADAWHGLCDDIGNWYRTRIEPTLNTVKGGFQAVGDAIGRFLSNPVATIQKAWEGLSGWFDKHVIQPIQRAFSWMRIDIPAPKLPHINWNWLDIDYGVGKVSIPQFNGIDWYANGGFPTSGQLFMAREDGLTELVGTMGNKSAVANNQQIVEGIEQGVMSAMIQVLPSFQEQQGGDVTLVLQVGNEQLAKAVNRGNASLVRRGQIKPEFQFA